MTGSKTRRKLDPISVLGELIITFGVLALLFAFYDVVWTDITSSREQAAADNALDDLWDPRNPRPMTNISEGAAFARIHIPAFGSDFSYAVVKGTNDDDLDKGPGHYDDTQMPGEKGNFALAGHRVGRGSPFNDLGRLETCDSIVVETETKWDIYRVLPIDVPEDQRLQAAEDCMDPELAKKMSEGEYAAVQGRHITLPSDVDVLNPVPGNKDMKVFPDDEALLTMTTCHPQFSNAERMIVHAVMVREDAKKPGVVPKELEED